MRVFPDAKVLLTVRDPERWYESVKSTIYKNRHRLSGNTGLFLKIVGRYRMAQTAVMCSNQGYPVTKMGMGIKYNIIDQFFFQNKMPVLIHPARIFMLIVLKLRVI